MTNIDIIADIIYEHIGGVTDDLAKSEGIHQLSVEIAGDIVAKVPQLDRKVESKTNANPRFDRYRTFPEFDDIKGRQVLETWLSCLLQGKNPIEEILWQRQSHS